MTTPQSQNPLNNRLFLRFCSIGPAKAHPNLSAKSGSYFWATPKAGRKLSFSIGELFPNLSCPVVAAVNRSDFDAGLHNQPSAPPVMLHHVPRALARNVGQDKIAFLVVDGLALDQWIVMRRVLHEQRPAIRFHESAVFAWMPTITSVSRQAAFAGKAPLYFPSSIQHTGKEGDHWTQFWLDQGLTRQEVAYTKGLDDGGFDRELKLKWLDATADLLLEGMTAKDILTRLNAVLEGELANSGTRGAKGKTITVLLHIWVKLPDIAKPLRTD